MGNERDIDDILESLNQLLHEAGSHNDDHVETEAEAAAKNRGQAIEHEMLPDDVMDEASELEAADFEMDEAELHAFANGIDSEHEAVETEVEPVESELPEFELSESEPDEPEKADVASDGEPDTNTDTDAEVEEAEELSATATASEPFKLTPFEIKQDSDETSEAQDDEGGSPAVPRVVLTEAMLVHNPQGSLLAEAKAAVEPAQEESPQAAPEERGDSHPKALHVDHQHMAQLLERVSDDVIRQLQQELPSLIKTSLYRHLEELKKAEPAADRTDKPEE